ncbi:MAG: chemotaxis protein [Micavibrio aeruginosavorus]|uniref:Chemotaxis protein n=1 Tax=Micavibrio aeruginosavorus TaxID=349221 RepID=A0A2W5MUT0_9BACT|nr:MAG: chemotaxis protein [Micavibrio aeruginosavorus]
MFAKQSSIPSGARQVEKLSLTGHERYLHADDIIVSKTDLQGKITYVNKIFMDISDYSEKEMLGAPHSAIRHPHMPRVIFKLLWETITSGKEIFAYVMNRCKNGDHYWVMAHVTPSYTLDRKLLGYHSNRRAPRREALEVIIPLYKELYDLEQKIGRKDGLDASFSHLQIFLKEKEVSYEKFILSI